MIEKWIQISCDGCGNTSTGEHSNQTADEIREDMRKYGWKNHGRLDYCRECVENGREKVRKTGFGCEE